MYIKNIFLIILLVFLCLLDIFVWWPPYLFLFYLVLLSLYFKHYFKDKLKLNFITIFLFFFFNRIIFYFIAGSWKNNLLTFKYYHILSGLIFSLMWLLILFARSNNIKFKSNNLFRMILISVSLYFLYFLIEYFAEFNSSDNKSIGIFIYYFYLYLNIYIFFIFINKILIPEQNNFNIERNLEGNKNSNNTVAPDFDYEEEVGYE